MIDKDIFDRLDPDMRKAVVIALGVVGESGIIREQQLRERETLLQGSDEQDAAELAGQIKTYRVRSQTLESLQQLCDTIS